MVEIPELSQKIRDQIGIAANNIIERQISLIKIDLRNKILQ